MLFRDPSNVFDQTTCEIAIGSKLGMDATKKLRGEDFTPDTRVGALIKMDTAVKAKVDKSSQRA